MNTLRDVEQTFNDAPDSTKMKAAAKIYSTDIADGWDIGPFYRHGFQSPEDFGNGSTLGTGPGALTAQFSCQGGPLSVYHAGSVNYALWGKMFSLCRKYFGRFGDDAGHPQYSEGAAVNMTLTHKFLSKFTGTGGPYAKEACAFVRFGYSGQNPSAFSMQTIADPKNVAAPARFKWKWIGLRDPEG